MRFENVVVSRSMRQARLQRRSFDEPADRAQSEKVPFRSVEQFSVPHHSFSVMMLLCSRFSPAFDDRSALFDGEGGN
jgi:hypothetical protein